MIAASGGRRKRTPEEREAKRQQDLADQRTARVIAKRVEGWREIAKYQSSSSDAMHTVERNGQTNEYRCTCQGFRIHKRGYCKHTQRAQWEVSEGLL